MFITFLTDFGLQDDFVGTCHGVIKRIAPEAQIIDITHGIPPRQVLQGALVLANTLPYMPVGRHLAVVDPGVGGGRRPLALRDADGRYYVGPDNGLLLPAAERFGGDRRRRTSSRIPRMRSTRSRARSTAATSSRRRRRTSRAASRSASSARRSTPTRSCGSTCRSRSSGRRASSRTILYVDSFGNVALNLTRDHVDRGGDRARDAGRARSRRRARTTPSRRGRSRDARPGDLILYEDSYRNMSLAISSGNAAEMLHARIGQPVRINVGRI